MSTLLSFVVLSYIFSGYICCLAFLDCLERQSPPLRWQRLFAVLACLTIVISWPAWIIIEVIRLLAVPDGKKHLQDKVII